MQQYSLLIALGQILKIDELTQLQLEQAEVKYRISPGLVTIEHLLLRSPNLRLTAQGTINFNGRLRLDSQLAINEKVRRQLFSPVRDNFLAVSDPPGYSALDFKISGTVDRPRTDLMNKLVGRDLQDLGGVISSLFGHAKKKKKEEPPASPRPQFRLTNLAQVGRPLRRAVTHRFQVDRPLRRARAWLLQQTPPRLRPTPPRPFLLLPLARL